MTSLITDHTPEGDEIVISGLSGLFPSANNIEEFWEKLLNKEDLIKFREDILWKNNKLDISNKVGKIDVKEKFDAGFYAMHRGIVTSSDPLILCTLERAFEAIVDAGLNPSSLKGTNTAVFTGSVFGESEHVRSYTDVSLSYGMLGHNRGMLSHRISYWLGTTGTTVSIATMETCGFETFHTAYNEMKQGRCDTCIVGVANLIYTPELCENFRRLGILSNTNMCKPFDAEADGYLLSEGVVVMLLQRARNAKRVYATVVNSEISQYGERIGGLIIPEGDHFAHMMQKFYNSCGLEPTEVAYLEAEGTGVKTIDEEEMKAVDKVFLKNRKTPLLIGSVKSNMGHSQGAANFCAVTKVLLAMQKGVIPPNLYYNKPSEFIPALNEGRAKVVSEVTPWDGGLAALNGISLSGTYAHLLLKSYDRKKSTRYQDDELLYLICTSSRTEDGLKEILHKLEAMPVDPEFIALMHGIHSSDIANHMYRGFTVVPQINRIPQAIKHLSGAKRPVWFIFSGMGSQWPKMGQALMKLPVCVAAIEKCHQILEEKGLDLKHIICTDDSKIFDNILNSFVGIAAIQIALVDMLNALGIKADGTIGHSVGELGCAYACGCLSLEEMILSAYYRGIASLQAELIPGFMAAIGLGHHAIKPLLPPEIDVACHNSETSCTISGPEDIVKAFVKELQSKNIFARTVNVSNIAYHSRYIQPAAPLLLGYLEELVLNPKQRPSHWYSSSVPESRWNTPLAQYCSAEYLTNNLLSPVLFEEVSKQVPKNAIAIEISPHGLLQSILRRSLGSECVNIPLAQRGQDVTFILSAVGKLYLAGLTPQLKELYPPVEMPVSRGTPSISPLIRWNHDETWPLVTSRHELSKGLSGEKFIHVHLNDNEFGIYKGCQTNGTVLLPASGYLKIVWEILTDARNLPLNQKPVVFENVHFFNQLEIQERESCKVHVLLQRGSGLFEISCEDMLLVTGRITMLENVADSFDEETIIPDKDNELTGDDVYAELEQRGYEYSGLFKGIHKMNICEKGFVAKVHWQNNWVPFIDALFQLMLIHSSNYLQGLKFPASIQRISIDPSKHRNQKQELDVVYHSAIKELRCGGVNISGIKFESFSSVPNKNNHHQLLKTMKFVTYSNPMLKNVRQFISLSLQWTIENISSSYADVAVFHCSIEDIIKSLLPQYPKIKLNLGMEYLKSYEKSYDLAVVTEMKYLEAGISVIGKGGFLLVQMEDDSWKIKKTDLCMIVEQEFGNVKMVLYRKTESPNGYNPQLVYVNGSMSTWLQQIRGVGICHRLYAIIQLDSLGVETMLNYMQKFSRELGLEHVRYVFILGRKDPTFSVSESVYKKDLIINVFCNGEWGNICFLPFQVSSLPEKSLSGYSFSSSLEKIKMNFLGLNLQYMTSSESATSSKVKHTDLGLMDFSGNLKNENRIMGITRLDTETKKLASDQYLMWEVPKEWSQEQASTISVPYAIAYYALILKAQLEHGDSVLIQAGWSCIGQAAITLALDYSCTVYTTAMNKEQRNFIKERFPQLLDNHIFSYEGAGFEQDLLLETRTKGVKVIVNCISDSRLQASVRCLASYGRFVQVFHSNINTNQSIGMEIFLKSTEFHGVSAHNLHTLSPELKKLLHFGLKDMLQRGVIKPIQYSVFPEKQIEQAVSTATDFRGCTKVLLAMNDNDEKSFPLGGLFSDSQGFYLVLGYDLDQCLDVAKWLAVRSVKYVAVMIRNDNIPKEIEHKLKLLHTYHKTKVIVLKACVSNASPAISDLLQEVSSLFEGPMEGIFILPLEDVSNENGVTSSTVAAIDIESRKYRTLRHFVCMLTKNSWSVCEKRHKEGFPALSIFWNQHRNEKFNLLHSMRVLDSLLTSKEYGPVILADDEELLSHNLDTFSPTILLPNSLNTVASYGEDLQSDSSWIVEMSSLSPGFGKVKEVPPVFLIPGLQGPPTEFLRPLARKLIYPVLCCRIVEPKNTIKDTAAVLVKHIKEIQCRGAYNLVGICWGGAITLEVAKLLEEEGHETRVILIDGAPETIQASAQQLNRDGNFNVNFVSTILKSKEIHEISSNTDWSALLDKVLKDVSLDMKSQASHALTVLRSCIAMLLDYKPSQGLLKGEVSLVRTYTGSKDDSCGLQNLCKHSVSIHKLEENHGTILSNPETARTINDFIL